MSLDYIYSDVNSPNKVIVWDLGKRCNYDCTYCTAWMHSKTAAFNKFSQYKKTADFIDSYNKLYELSHKQKFRTTISFTGGEPAINPDFYQLVPYLRENYPYMYLNLTTNGTWSKRRGQFLLDHMHSITVSYHCEGTTKQKNLIRDNLLWVKKNIKDDWRLKVNVMMHVDYFDECVDLIENFLKPNDIRYIPRTIGDDNRYKSKWFKDEDGMMRRTSHVYTTEQQNYIKNHWDKKNEEAALTSDGTKQEIKIDDDKNDGHIQKMGRMCCGGRCMTIKDSETGNVTDAAFIQQNNFKGWQCMINYFFLHIEEDKDAIYHHQTCMAKLDGTPEVKLDPSKFGNFYNDFTEQTGPICSISESDKYLEWLEEKIYNGEDLIITCPNTHCGCGICIAKAKNTDDFKNIASNYINIRQL